MSMPGPGIVPKVPTVVRDDPSDEREGGERAASEHPHDAGSGVHHDHENILHIARRIYDLVVVLKIVFFTH